jgi:3-methyladenine DNA glycosylase AlkD
MIASGRCEAGEDRQSLPAAACLAVSGSEAGETKMLPMPMRTGRWVECRRKSDPASKPTHAGGAAAIGCDLAIPASGGTFSAKPDEGSVVLAAESSLRFLLPARRRDILCRGQSVICRGTAMTAAEIVAELKKLGSESYKRTLIKHGAKEPFLGVKIEDLKKIQKRIKKDYQLALDLFDTGIGDAMYLAGLIADDEKMTKKDLQKWVEAADWYFQSEYAVGWTAAESRYGWELGLAWIDSKKEGIASTGWSTLSSLVSIKPDEELDLAELKRLLGRVEKTIHDAPNRVRYVMNGFVIAVGSYVAPLTEQAIKTAKKIGAVAVDMGETACQVPDAEDYIDKVKKRGSIGKKRKMARC